jgi:hypothetical protein
LGVIHLSADGQEGTQSVDQFVDHLGELAAIGIDEAIVSMRNVSDPEAFLLLPEVVRQAALITPAGR